VTREQLENLCSDLFDRVTQPIERALTASKLTLDDIGHIIIVGAGTRMPKVQEVLAAFTKRELGKNLNADEAAALGAVYRAADLSTGFQVKKFMTKDAVVLPIEVQN
jgi:hypoxia up-regulated 1